MSSNILQFQYVISRLGGLEQTIFDGCLTTEEIAYGCTGIATAIETSGLGV